jgi:molybdopterin converting factor small subunit
MQVTVEYTAQIKRAAGIGSEEYTLDAGAESSTLLSQIVNRHEQLTRFLITEAGEPQPTLLLFIDEQQTRWDANTKLSDGAKITLMTPISGG